LYLGLDGGGTKTAGAITGPDGTILARLRTGPSAIVGPVNPRSRKVMAGLVRNLLRQARLRPSGIAFCAVGLNGIDFPDEYPVQIRGVSSAIGLPARKVALVNDAIPALWGATDSPAACLLQHGSGKTSALRKGFGAEECYDHLDAGSLYDIRGELARAVARMIDGRLKATPLLSAALRRYGVRHPRDYAEALYRRRIPWRRILFACDLAYRYWLKGDPVAGRLVRDAAEDYALTGAAMVRKTGVPTAVAAFGGGVLDRAPERFWSLLRRRLAAHAPRARMAKPAMKAELGACVMAAFRDGREPGSYFRAVEKDLRKRFRSGA
jgi:N-acetylglucosamine kinase-like BadF-type ATPase